jgi:hypothetical protein
MRRQLAPACHKNGNIQVQTSEKSDSACPQETLYTMPAALWKLHHPVFCGAAAFFCGAFHGGDFQLRGDLGCLFSFDDISAGTDSSSFGCRKACSGHNNIHDLSNSYGTYRKNTDTSHNKF